jgi:hypothetical protein
VINVGTPDAPRLVRLSSVNKAEYSTNLRYRSHASSRPKALIGILVRPSTGNNHAIQC